MFFFLLSFQSASGWLSFYKDLIYFQRISLECWEYIICIWWIERGNRNKMSLDSLFLFKTRAFLPPLYVNEVVIS